jgi:predicted nucleic acid-binding protein
VDTNKISFFTAWQLYENRTDKNWGITDCTSFGIMSERDVMDVLTYDIHFAQAGFRPLLREEP